MGNIEFASETFDLVAIARDDRLRDAISTYLIVKFPLYGKPIFVTFPAMIATTD